LEIWVCGSESERMVWRFGRVGPNLSTWIGDLGVGFKVAIVFLMGT
jgi:hypothetical protein